MQLWRRVQHCNLAQSLAPHLTQGRAATIGQMIRLTASSRSISPNRTPSSRILRMGHSSLSQVQAQGHAKQEPTMEILSVMASLASSTGPLISRSLGEHLILMRHARPLPATRRLGSFKQSTDPVPRMSLVQPTLCSTTAQDTTANGRTPPPTVAAIWETSLARRNLSGFRAVVAPQRWR